MKRTKEKIRLIVKKPRPEEVIRLEYAFITLQKNGYSVMLNSKTKEYWHVSDITKKYNCKPRIALRILRKALDSFDYYDVWERIEHFAENERLKDRLRDK
mgnify:CR=1 FL=1|tara:strand:- start:100 stop:399 length:300 start_codon:yes stop_codon:yes gene_type:complete